MFKKVIRTLKQFKLFRKLFQKNYNDIQLKNAEDMHPWQKDLDHLAQKLGEDAVEVPFNKAGTEMAESTVVEEDFKNLFKEAKSELQQKQSKTDNKPVVVKKKTREADITAVDLKNWWGNSVATWDPDIDGKNVQNVNDKRKRQKTKWFNN